MGETGFLEQTDDQEAHEVPPGEDTAPEDLRQSPAQEEETDEVQLEFEAEQDVEEQIPLRRSQRGRRRPRYLEKYEY